MPAAQVDRCIARVEDLNPVGVVTVAVLQDSIIVSSDLSDLDAGSQQVTPLQWLQGMSSPPAHAGLSQSAS
jgi:hypothetical protein